MVNLYYTFTYLSISYIVLMYGEKKWCYKFGMPEYYA